MPFLDAEALLQPVSAEAPCGPNLEADAAFNALETLARGKPEAEFQKPSGEFIRIPAQEAKWRDVKSEAEALFRRSKDLRTFGYLAAAAAREHGYAGFRDALVLLRGLVDRYWEPLHPQLDPADPDPIVRTNAIGTLAAPPLTAGDPYQIVSKLLDAPLSNSRQLGRFGLRQYRVAAGEESPDLTLAAAGPPPQASTIASAFKDTPPEELASTRAAVAESLDALEAVRKGLSAKIGADKVPTFAPLEQTLKSAASLLDTYLGTSGDGPAADAAVGSSGARAGQAGGGGAGSGGGTSLSGDIRSSRDVLTALDKITRYYQQSEVSSPVPVVMAAAKRLVGRNFPEISRILTPDAIRVLEEIGNPPGDKTDKKD